jgi:KUP system potassium uptake protein
MFFGANLVKVLQGGWLPLIIGSCVFTIMTTWKTGRAHRRRTTHGARDSDRPLHVGDQHVAACARSGNGRLHDGAAARNAAGAGAQSPSQQGDARACRDSDRDDCARTARRPDDHAKVDDFGLVASTCCGSCYGFMQDPNVPDALRAAQSRGLDIDADDVTYFLGRETILVTLPPRNGDLAREAVRA